MAILIDGYNLLNATGVEGVGGGTELERARRGLLNFLASVLSEDELAGTTIVFDAQGAPPGLPRSERFSGISVLYAREYAEADDLLEELIARDHAPRQLLVVSSDHRLQRAARRRRATPIDSDVWVSQLEMRRHRSPRPPPQKPSPSPEQADSWLAEFSDVDILAIHREIQHEDAAPSTPGQQSSKIAKSPDDTSGSEDAAASNQPPLKGGRDALREDAEEIDDLANPFPEDFGRELDEEEHRDADDIFNPFPPGYGEDISEDDV